MTPKKLDDEVKRIVAVRNELEAEIRTSQTEGCNFVEIEIDLAKKLINTLDFLMLSQCLVFNQHVEYSERINNLAELLKAIQGGAQPK